MWSSVKIKGDGHSFYRDRDPSIVRLNRRHNATSPNGIFRCIIPSSVTPIATKNIYIGIYDIGQGRVFAHCHDHNGLFFSFSAGSGIPQITSFKFSRSSKSLNCTSSGGPVTTVSWKRNNQKLTTDGNPYQQTQVIVDKINAEYKNILYSNDASTLVGVFTCMVENARGSDSMTVSTNGKLLKSTVNNIMLHFIIIHLQNTIGAVIENADNYTVGSDATITCRSDTATEGIEWLTQERTIIVYESNATQLNLTFTPVNDSIHGQVYICRVIRNDSDTPEQNFTMNVEGK